jgi:hypothetical protein
MFIETVLVLSQVWLASTAPVQSVVEGGTVAVEETEATLVNDELDTGRIKLLDLAGAAASAVPTAPHAKTRAKLQQDVAEALLRLGQPKRAEAHAEEMLNWRRGVVLGDLAVHCAKQGRPVSAAKFIAAARTVAQLADVEITQDWQRDRILSRVAVALAHLGELEAATAFSGGLVESESGSLVVVGAERSTRAEFDQQLGEIERVAANRQLEPAKRALEACAQLHQRFYTDAELRGRAESALKRGFDSAKLPFEIRVHLMRELFETALAHGDIDNAHRLVAEIDGLSAAVSMESSYSIPFRAELAGLRARAGQTERARAELEELFAQYFRERLNWSDHKRADILLPLAVAFARSNEPAKAIAAYRHAVAEAGSNPNARARVEDLVAVSLSMAENRVDPDLELWNELEKLRAGLVSPW